LLPAGKLEADIDDHGVTTVWYDGYGSFRGTSFRDALSQLISAAEPCPKTERNI
jgi:hypothetical protein